MNNLKLDQNTLRLLFYQYKNYLIPGSIIGACIFLFSFFIVPQVQNVFGIPDQEIVLKEKLSVLTKNIQLMAAIPQGDLDSQAKIVTQALPLEKDFAGIITALSVSANNAGVSLGDYGFQVGALSTSSTNLTIKKPFIEVTVELTGGITGTKRFLEELTYKLPLSEIVSTQVGKNTASVKILFYYKPFTETQFSQDTLLQPLEEKEKELLLQIASWQADAPR